METCRETRTYTFNSPNVEKSINYPEVPSKTVFKKNLMKLNIQVTVNAGDDHIQTEILENRKRFKQEHKGRDTELSLDTTTLNLQG